VREDNGEKVFDLVYGIDWVTRDITKEEFDERQGVRCYQQHTYDENGNRTPTLVYKMYENRHNVIGTVRPDDTFEFTKESYGQGERMYLSGFVSGFFLTDSRRGGMIYKRGTLEMLPIWKGMRVHLGMGKLLPTEPCEVQILHVDRKAAKDLIAKYEHFFKVSEVMLKSINDDQFFQLAKEVLGEKPNEKDMAQKAMEIMNDAPLDAFVMFAWAHDIDRMRFRMKYQNAMECSPYEDFYMKTKRKVTKEIYLDNTDVFVPKTYPMGEVFPANDWGTTILVNGKVMEQYT
jgi:hypothetical protein